MAKKLTLAELREAIRKQKFRIFKLEQDIRTYQYLETMPEYDPWYKYCYGTSNFGLSLDDKDVDAWLRAVALHINARKPQHGGGQSNALVVTCPTMPSHKSKQNLIDYTVAQLQKKIKVRKASATDS
jgi:hypothetical protein